MVDESHRSIYNTYGEVLNHFKTPALGLTATPTDIIDHNTLQLFHCEDGLPTFAYTFAEAVNNVPPFQLTFGPAAAHEEIETWKEVYGIDERYKVKCCDSDAKDWLERVRILRDTYCIAPETSLATFQQQTAKAPVANSNFLKLAFLEGCQRAGLFDAIAMGGAAP